MSERPRSFDIYPALTGLLLVALLIVGTGLYAATVNNQTTVTSPRTPYRYALTDPPNQNSIRSPNTQTPSPQYTTWNGCGVVLGAGCNMTSGGWREGTIPDTFDYFVSFTSTVPVSVYFFTMGQLAQFAVCNGDLNCVSGYYSNFPASTSLQNGVFKLGEGCADYVAIYLSSSQGVMYPNVKVAYNPAPYPTGYCAQQGA